MLVKVWLSNFDNIKMIVTQLQNVSLAPQILISLQDELTVAMTRWIYWIEFGNYIQK